MLTVNDVGEATRVSDGSTTQVRSGACTLMRILVGAAPGGNRTITLRDGTVDGDPIKTVITVPTTISYPCIPVGLEFRLGCRAIFSGAVDVTFIWSG